MLGKPNRINHKGILGSNKLRQPELPDLKKYIRILRFGFTNFLLVEKLSPKKSPEKKPSFETGLPVVGVESPCRYG